MVNIGTPKSLITNNCKKKSITTKVTPGEVCTLEVAKQLGIDDPDNYFTGDFSATKTLNATIDDSDDNRIDTLCYKSNMIDKEEFYPHCILEHGPGYVRKKGSPDTCKTVECPPEFTFDASKNACKKKEKDALILKKNKCSERWNDWFTIPNYHLGNKYQSIDKNCYTPCENSFIPSYSIDPIDENESSDKPDYCMHKYNYLGGKYKDSADYCPIAVIKNIGNTKQDFKYEYEKMIKNTVNSSKEKEELFKNMDNEIKNITKNRENIITQNTREPNSEELIACNNLNTDERVAETYSICRNLHTNEDSFIEKFMQDGDSKSKAELRVNSLKRACNSLYCSVNNNLTDAIAGTEWPPGSCKKDDENCRNILSGEPICFNNIKNIDLEKEAKRLREEENKTYPEINSKKGQKSVIGSFNMAIGIIVLPIIIITIYYTSKKFLLPKVILPLWYNVVIRVWKYIYVYVIQNIIPSRLNKITIDEYKEYVDLAVNKYKLNILNDKLESISNNISSLNLKK